MTPDERDLKAAVTRWVDRSAPSAPGLEARVLAGLGLQSATARTPRWWREPSWPATAVAFFLGVVLVLTLMAGARAINASTTSSSGRALEGYRDLADSDYTSLYVAAHASDNPCSELFAMPCRTDKLAARQAAASFLADLNQSSPPAALEPLNSIMRTDLQSLIKQLGRQADLLAVSPTPVSDAYDLVDLSAIQTAIAQIDCWPKPGVVAPYNDFLSRRPPTAVCGSS